MPLFFWYLYSHDLFVSQGFPIFGAAIVVVRNPLDALVAEWNRKQSFRLQNRPRNETVHVGYVGKEQFSEFIVQLLCGMKSPINIHDCLQYTSFMQYEISMIYILLHSMPTNKVTSYQTTKT